MSARYEHPIPTLALTSPGTYAPTSPRMRTWLTASPVASLHSHFPPKLFFFGPRPEAPVKNTHSSRRERRNALFHQLIHLLKMRIHLI
jgi:hypothetical protein